VHSSLRMEIFIARILCWRSTANSSRDIAVERYSCRDFTYDKDVLGGFGGISNCLDRLGDTKIVWRLPARIRATALSWISRVEDREERLIKCYVRNRHHPAGVVEVAIPSWYWMGCIPNGAAYKNPEIFLLQDDSTKPRYVPYVGILFYIINQDGEIEKLPASIIIHAASQQSPVHKTSEMHSATEALNNWKSEGRKTTVTTQDIPKHLLQLDIARSLLIFYTSSARVPSLP
jgi:hypothetical protein